MCISTNTCNYNYKWKIINIESNVGEILIGLSQKLAIRKLKSISVQKPHEY
jgi:hypothetical protein